MLALLPGAPREETPPALPRPGPPPVPKALAPIDSNAILGIGEQLREKRYALAVAACEKLRQERPDDEWLRSFEADCLLDAGDVERALAFVASCSDAGPAGARALAVRAFVHARRKDPAAREEAERAIARDGRLARAWVARALVLLEGARTDPSLGDGATLSARRALSLAPPALGAANVAQGRAMDATGALSKEGAAYRDGEAVFEATQNFERLLPPPGEKPKEEVELLVKGRHYLGTHEWRLALERAERAIELNPHRPAAYSVAGSACMRMGDNDDNALAFLLRGIQLDAWNLELNDVLAEFYIDKKRDGRSALERLDLAIQLAPTADRYIYRSLACGMARDEAGSVANLDRAVELDTRHTALVRRARHRLDRGEPRLALEDAESAVRRAPDDASVHITVADALLALGETERAIAECERGLAEKPDEASVHLLRGRIALAHDDLVTARQELEAFRAVFSGPPLAEGDALAVAIRKLGKK
jgi:tetratricopeptide (TPR) repeat protein